jgi:lysophospholipase L1-like esterase
MIKITRKQLIKLINEALTFKAGEEKTDLSSVVDKPKKTGGEDKSSKKSKISKDQKIKVLFVGDSQTNAGFSYANKLLKDENISGVNSSQNGASLKTIKSFLDKNLKPGKFDVITIMGGGNNSKTSIDKSGQALSTYDQMYSAAKKSGALVVAITNPTKTNLSNQKTTYPSNEYLAQYVKKHNTPDIVIDANSIFKAAGYFRPDKIHLNRSAHDKLQKMWLSKVFN